MAKWKGKVSDRALRTRVRERQVLALRKNGASFEQIARVIGFKERTGAYKAYRRALADIPREEAHDMRQLESARLDDALMSIYQRVMAGDLEAIDMLVRIVGVRARLMGLNVNRSPDLAINLEVQKAYIGVPVEDV